MDWTQTVGKTEAVRAGAELVRAPVSRVTASISDPRWPNHEAIVRSIGPVVASYRCHERTSAPFDVEGVLEDIGHLPTGLIVVLRGCSTTEEGVPLFYAGWRWPPLSCCPQSNESGSRCCRDPTGFEAELRD